MLNKVSTFIRQNKLIERGDHIICAVSGGADSVALLWALYLLRDKLEITLSAAHFNHRLRGEESDRDQEFVRSLCHRYDIALSVGSAEVSAGKKGLEAAAREARYAYFASLSGKIATAHTADDNAETVLMHLIRGTGLKGLGGISPVRGSIIRPMLTVTRDEIIAFLTEYNLSYVDDSSNGTDAFLRNRIRHHIMPLLRQENPGISGNMSQMALRLRQDEQILQSLTKGQAPDIPTLRQMPQPVRYRVLSELLQCFGVKEPEADHILLAENLVFSDKPSARASFPNGVVLRRCYDRLEKEDKTESLPCQNLPCPGSLTLPELGLRIRCRAGQTPVLQWDRFTVYPKGQMVIRARKTGDMIRLKGGRKSLKEIMIDRKIPADRRNRIPVIADDDGVLAVWGIGANLDRTDGNGTPVEICFDKL